MKRLDILILIFIACFFGLSLVASPYIPDTVPTHWDASGEIDGYGSKYINLYLLPAIAFVVYLLMTFLPKADPLKENYEKFGRAYGFFKIILVFFFLYLHLNLLQISLGTAQMNSFWFFIFPFSLLFITIGALLPQIKRNFFIGIRTPWALVSDYNWEKTHKLGAYLFVGTGLVMLISSIFSVKLAFGVFICLILASVLLLFIYSYLLHKKSNKQKQDFK